MPVEVLLLEADRPFSVIRCSGWLSESDIIQSLRYAFVTGTMRPGRDRIVLFDAAVEMHDLNLTALQRIQEKLLEFERDGVDQPAYRSVLTVESPSHKMIAKLYKAVWDGLNLTHIEYHVVDSWDAALDTLGLPPSQKPV